MRDIAQTRALGRPTRFSDVPPATPAARNEPAGHTPAPALAADGRAVPAPSGSARPVASLEDLVPGANAVISFGLGSTTGLLMRDLARGAAEARLAGLRPRLQHVQTIMARNPEMATVARGLQRSPADQARYLERRIQANERYLAPTTAGSLRRFMGQRALPALVTAVSAYGVYNRIREFGQARNRTAAGIGLAGSVISTAGAAGMLHGGNVKASLGAYAVGTIAQTVGDIFNR